MITNTRVLTASSFTSMFFLGVGTAIIGAASGNIGLSPFQTGLLVSVQNLGFACTVLTAGALSDAGDKPRLLAGGSFLLAASFFLFYLWQPYLLNLLIMFFLGAGIGIYEGVADAMLISIHRKRQGLFVSINHFFVTLGCLLITLYLIFLQMDWRRSAVQSAAAVLVLALVFAFSRAGSAASASPPLGERFAFLKSQRTLAVFLAVAVIAVGNELGLVGLLTGFLVDLRNYDLVSSKLGLVLFLSGVAAGRVLLGILSAKGRILGTIIFLLTAEAVISFTLFFFRLPPAATSVLLLLLGVAVSVIFPLLITLTGTLYPGMSGTALGIVKLGVPAGGILVPFAISLISRYASFAVSLVVFPALALAGATLLASNVRGVTLALKKSARP